MSTTPKHSKQTKVQVRKWHIGPVWAEHYQTITTKPGNLAPTESCHVVTGFSGSAREIKKAIDAIMAKAR